MAFQCCFSQSFIAKLPDDFINDDEVETLNAASPSGRRHSIETMSVFERVQSVHNVAVVADSPEESAGELILEIGPEDAS